MSRQARTSLDAQLEFSAAQPQSRPWRATAADPRNEEAKALAQSQHARGRSFALRRFLVAKRSSTLATTPRKFHLELCAGAANLRCHDSLPHAKIPRRPRPGSAL